MHFGERLGQREAEACPVGVAILGLGDLLEGLAKTGDVLRRNADAGIGDAEVDFRPALFDADCNPAAPVGELDRVGDKVQHHLADGAVVGVDVRQVLRAVEHQLDLLLLGLPADHPHRGVHRINRVDELRRDRHLAGFNLGNVENVVDHVEQVLAGREDVAGIVLVRGMAERAGEFVHHDFRETDDGIQRRAQFVAHVGEEGRLGEGGVLGLGLLLGILARQGLGLAFRALEIERSALHLLLLLLQLFLVADVLGHIDADRQQATIGSRALDHLQPAPGAQGDQRGTAIFQRLTFHQHSAGPCDLHRLVAHAGAQRVLKAKIAGEGAVPVEQPLARIPQGERPGEAFDGGAQAALGRADTVLGLLAVGHIQHDAAEHRLAADRIVRQAAAHLDPAVGRRDGRESQLQPADRVRLGEGLADTLMRFNRCTAEQLINGQQAGPVEAEQHGGAVAEKDGVGGM